MKRKNFQILVLHGPNLNLLGQREPEIYGKATLQEINRSLDGAAKNENIRLKCRQSNSEGTLIDVLHEHVGKIDGLLINPGALAHTSYALRDAIAAVGVPTVEVHLTNLYRRESWRKLSVIAPVCVGVVMGFGPDSYLLGLKALLEFVRGRSKLDM